VDVGVAGDPFNGPVVVSSPTKIIGGTMNFCTNHALTIEETDQCIASGRKSLNDMVEKNRRQCVEEEPLPLEMRTKKQSKRRQTSSDERYFITKALSESPQWSFLE
jgi:hypothetical protein